MTYTTMNKTRIKICGITRKEDIHSAAQLGVDALGFVFVSSSPRCINIDQAGMLIHELPPFIQSVGLFMNQSEQEIREVLQAIPLNLLQFHGEESPAFCQQFALPYIKAIPMGGEIDALHYAAQYSDSSGFLLDSHSLGESGGSGDKFDWDKIPQPFGRPLILAGGLNVANIKEAVKQVRPYAVDVSSGVEVSKGIKDPEKMAAFVRGVREGDR